MKKCIIFGAGYVGRGAWFKLKEFYDIAAYADNNPALWGTEVNGAPVIDPESLKQLHTELPADIIICSDSYNEISAQLVLLGIDIFFIIAAGFLFRCGENSRMVPVRLGETPFYTKRKREERSILFVQNAACIRTGKIASLLKEAGFCVSLLYTVAPPDMNNKEFGRVFDNIYTVYTMEQLIEFVDNSEFDIVHSSNEPDYLANLLLRTNKKVIHDTHDMASIRSDVPVDVLAAEYLANKGAHGLMYISEGVKKIAGEKYQVKENRVYVLENLMVDDIKVKQRKRKLSELDGKIHCVYEGGISPDPSSHRYFEKIWEKLAQEGIHVHYYSHQNVEYCRKLENRSGYFHYEGNLSSRELVDEMTQYDCGLAIFNVTKANRIFLETGSANKVYEYINAGLPVAVGPLQSHISFVEKNRAGMEIDLEKALYPQFEKLSSMKISNAFLQEHHLTMDSQINELKNFYLSTGGINE